MQIYKLQSPHQLAIPRAMSAKGSLLCITWTEKTFRENNEQEYVKEVFRLLSFSPTAAIYLKLWFKELAVGVKDCLCRLMVRWRSAKVI